MKKTIIFDLDGTLIDSDPITISAINEIRKEDKLSPLLANAISPFLATGGLILIQNTISNTNSIEENTEYLKRLRIKIFERKTEENILFPNVKAALKTKAKRNINLCICTNKGTVLAAKILSDLGISKYFKNIIADGDLDTRKPNKNNFSACMQNIKSLKSECVIIGDSTVDLELARNSGVDFLAYNNQTNIEFIRNFSGPSFKDYSQLTKSNLI